MADAASTASTGTTTATAPATSATTSATTPANTATQPGQPAVTLAIKQDVAAATEQKFTVKVDGKEVEVPLSELQKHYGLDKAATRRLQEAAAKEKSLNETMAKLRDDPDAYFKFAEKDPEEYAIRRLSEKHKKLLEEERIRELSPEQREVEDLRRRVAEAEAEKQRAADEQLTTKVKDTKQRIVNAVISTLEAFPEEYRKDDSLALQVFARWEHAVENYEELAKTGVKLTPEYVRDQVLKDMRGLSGKFLSGSEDADFDAIMPPKAMERLKKMIRAEMAKEAKDAAHPSLSQDPKVRGSASKKDTAAPRLTQSQLLRRVTLGH